ncbi:Retrovirus-related Pol polyprotein from transposon 412, partial [Stegodyphus mimosarum]
MINLNISNFECKPANVHALCYTDVECHFVIWSSMLVVFVLSILGQPVLAVNDAEVLVQRYPIRAQLETDLVISQAKVAYRHFVEHAALQQRRFVKNFSSIARPLHMLTEGKQKFAWTKECGHAFKNLKEALISAPILTYPQIDRPFILDRDGGNESVIAVLSQEIEGQERAVAYWSKCLSKPERNYCVTRKELLSIVKAVEHFHHYLYGRKFLLLTDHASLAWLLNFKNPEGQIARWKQRLQEYDITIRHRKGSSHGNADALSRKLPILSQGRSEMLAAKPGRLKNYNINIG